MSLILIIDPDIEQNAFLSDKGLNRLKKPGSKAIGIKSYRDRGKAFVDLGIHLSQKIVLQLLDLKVMF